MMTLSEINDITGFANGALFDSEHQVREYFRKSAVLEMLDPLSEERRDYEAIYSQTDFDAMADEVIAHRWHMTADTN